MALNKAKGRLQNKERGASSFFFFFPAKTPEAVFIFLVCQQFTSSLLFYIDHFSRVSLVFQSDQGPKEMLYLPFIFV